MRRLPPMSSTRSNAPEASGVSERKAYNSRASFRILSVVLMAVYLFWLWGRAPRPPRNFRRDILPAVCYTGLYREGPVCGRPPLARQGRDHTL